MHFISRHYCTCVLKLNNCFTAPGKGFVGIFQYLHMYETSFAKFPQYINISWILMTDSSL